MIIERQSMLTQTVSARDIDVTADQLRSWRDGTLIQVAMPNLTPEDREFIMNGITPEEWDDTFGAE